MKFGCHACLFGERIKTETDFILENILKTGFTGVEIGFRFFGDDLNYLDSKLNEYDLMLSGFHTALTFSEIHKNFQKTSEFLIGIAEKISELPDEIMPSKNMIMSAMFDDIEDLDSSEEILIKSADALEIIAKKIKEKGVTLNYHNHSIEFKNKAKIFNILNDRVKSMNFAFDMGWVIVGGYELKEVLEKTKGRVSYLHLRDVNKSRNDFTEMGKGIVDFKETMEIINTYLPKDSWLIVEYEFGEQDFKRYEEAYKFIVGLKRGDI